MNTLHPDAPNVTSDHQALMNIPDDLRILPQWVVWRRVERDGNVTKRPFQPLNAVQPASVTDPSTWGTFDNAVAVV